MITGGYDGISCAVAIAYAREGADVLISYPPEEQADAEETKRWVEAAGRACVLHPGDVRDPAYCRSIPTAAVAAFGRLDILVNNAAYQMSRDSLEEVADEERDRTIRTTLDALFHTTKAALAVMKPGARS